MNSSCSIVKTTSASSYEYGTPVVGSKTEARGKLAHVRISREVIELCEIIEQEDCHHHHHPPVASTREDLPPQITFGHLFQHYVSISNKVVGILLRARRHGLVEFQGEMLFQGQHDSVVITLLRSTRDIQRDLQIIQDEGNKEDGGANSFEWGNCFSGTTSRIR